MAKFRPCIDLHHGQVKQIVGGTLDSSITELSTNHISTHPASHFAQVYRDHNLEGGHIIKLGPGNDDAAKSALAVWPSAFQIGGGIDDSNAKQWLDWGAGKVIVTSCLFPDGKFSLDKLRAVFEAVGKSREKLVIDLSCRRKDETWVVAMNKWQTLTDMQVSQESIKLLEPFCSEFLIHAADNEGLQRGIDEELVARLAEWCSIRVTYAGGAKSIEDLETVQKLGGGKIDLTIGSALDMFGGTGVKFEDCLAWNTLHSNT
ncbi:MAG: Enzyme that catalyzes the fourth step in the histidine pathway [Vezdaea aestivalis]|nr:MAG: Enzyme that catalyzes the fourth step in the histidine pathway [Vezdaea aestivalis]